MLLNEFGFNIVSFHSNHKKIDENVDINQYNNGEHSYNNKT